MKRDDGEDVVFRSESGKWNAVRTEIARMHKKGRPVLVGTTSVERSEQIGELLDEDGIPYELLNAKPENVEREAEIVAQAGRRGAVTIATNMAGRGTDILLGGNAEFMARLRIREALMPRIVMPEGATSRLRRRTSAAPTRTGGRSRTASTRATSPPRLISSCRRLSMPPSRAGARGPWRSSRRRSDSPLPARRLPPRTKPRSRSAPRSTRWRPSLRR